MFLALMRRLTSGKRQLLEGPPPHWGSVSLVEDAAPPVGGFLSQTLLLLWHLHLLLGRGGSSGSLASKELLLLLSRERNRMCFLGISSLLTCGVGCSLSLPWLLLPVSRKRPVSLITRCLLWEPQPATIALMFFSLQYLHL